MNPIFVTTIVSVITIILVGLLTLLAKKRSGTQLPAHYPGIAIFLCLVVIVLEAFEFRNKQTLSAGLMILGNSILIVFFLRKVILRSSAPPNR